MTGKPPRHKELLSYKRLCEKYKLVEQIMVKYSGLFQIFVLWESCILHYQT